MKTTFTTIRTTVVPDWQDMATVALHLGPQIVRADEMLRYGLEAARASMHRRGVGVYMVRDDKGAVVGYSIEAHRVRGAKS